VDEPKPEQIINITGTDGESIFWHAKAWLVARRGARFQAELDEMWAHYKDIADDRLLALVGALCIENRVDALLQAIGPGFAECPNDPDFTFSLKIQVARSLRMIPSRILTACDLVRHMRNEFAHHLEMKGFGQCDDKYLRKLAPSVTAFNSAVRDATNYHDLFRDLVAFVLLALGVYTAQVADLRTYLETEGFRRAFKEWADTRK
jgi:hypothetical protein